MVSVMDMDNQKEFFRQRITSLRIQKNVSEYQMSYDLGKSRNYIQSISSGRALPQMETFFSICEYFNLTPQEFFDPNMNNPDLLHEAIQLLETLPKEAIEDVMRIIRRISQNLEGR